MKITKKILENIIKEEISKTLNEQISRKEIEEVVVVNGVEYKLLGQIVTMFGTTRVDLRLVAITGTPEHNPGDVVMAKFGEAKFGEDINKVKAKVKAALGIKQATK